MCRNKLRYDPAAFCPGICSFGITGFIFNTCTCRHICVLSHLFINHQTNHDLTVCKALPNQHMANQSLAGGFVIGRDLIFFHIGQNRLQNFFVVFHTQQAVRIGNNIVGASRIKAGYGISFLICPDRILSLISVTERRFHPHNGLHDPVNEFRCKATDTCQIVSDLILLKLQLAGIVHGLHLTTAALPVKSAVRQNTKRRRRGHLLQPSVAVILFYFGNTDLGYITDNGILYKKGITVYLSDSFTVRAHINDLYGYHLILLKIHNHSPNFFLFNHSPAVERCCKRTISSLLQTYQKQTTAKHSADYSSLVPLKLESNNLLKPSQPISVVFSIISVKVCSLASVLSAKFSATASIMAGFLGDPNSYSP